MSGPYFYTVEFDADKDDLNILTDWNINRHAPDMYKSGFQTTANYRCDRGVGPDFLNLYEVDTFDRWSSEAYTGAMARDPYTKQLMPLRKNVHQTLYRYVKPGGEELSETNALDADHVYMIWFDADSSGTHEWAANLIEEDARKFESQGMSGIRFMARTENRPGAKSGRPKYLALTEWTQAPPLEFNILNKRKSDFAGKLTSTSDHFGRRIFPWPNRKINW